MSNLRRITRPLFVALATAAVLAGWTAAKTAAQTASAQQPAPKLSAEQQKELDQLKQLEEQMKQDREAMREAANQYGWDSDQAQAAQEKLFRDRQEYRKLRQPLREAGVPVPPPAGMGARAGGPEAGHMGRHRGMGRHHAGEYYGCPCLHGE